MPHRNTILQALRKMLRFKTTLSLYREFYRQIGQPKLYKPFQRGVLEWNDVYPYLYLQAAFTGLQESRLIKHLVIDEMQDYTPIQYAVLNRLFPCPKTILGDFGQSIDPNRQYTLEQLHGLYPGSQLVGGWRRATAPPGRSSTSPSSWCARRTLRRWSATGRNRRCSPPPPRRRSWPACARSWRSSTKANTTPWASSPAPTGRPRPCMSSLPPGGPRSPW